MMDDTNELGAFLRARRQLVDPGDVGLETTGRRRVPGLRREEVAALAGVSSAYYTRLEQGHDRHPSDQILGALARVLHLDDETSRHMQAMTRPPLAVGQPTRDGAVRPQLSNLIDQQRTPAYALNGALDVLAANRAAQELHFSFRPGRNIVLDVFLDRQAQAGFSRPGLIQREVVAQLRTAMGLDPGDLRLQEVVEQISEQSSHFRHLWERHVVHTKGASTKSFAHPTLGEITLDYEALWVVGAERQQMVVYQAPNGSTAASALKRLASP